MKRLGTAKLTEYRVPTKSDFLAIKETFSDFIFNRKKRGKYFIMADARQYRIITEFMKIELIKT